MYKKFITDRKLTHDMYKICISNLGWLINGYHIAAQLTRNLQDKQNCISISRIAICESMYIIKVYI